MRSFHYVLSMTLLSIFLISQFSCGSLFKGARERFDFRVTINNSSDYRLDVRLSYDERSFEDECGSSSGSVENIVESGATEVISISALCHTEPSFSGSASYPSEAELTVRLFGLESREYVCSNEGCQ